MMALKSYSIKAVFVCLCALVLSVNFAVAQAGRTEISFPTPPQTIEALQSEISNLQTGTALTVEQKQTIEATYNSAVNELNVANQARQDAIRFERELREAETTEIRLQRDIDGLRQNLQSQADQEDLDRSLTLLERELSSRENDLRAYRTELTQYETTLDSLLQRPLKIREDLTVLRNDVTDFEVELTTLRDGTENEAEKAALSLIEAKLHRRQTQIIALESELAGLSSRQELVNLRRDIVTLKITQAEARVLVLQSRTGLRRIRLAQAVLEQAKSDLSVLEGEHPFVREYAAENYDLATKLSNIAENGGLYPRRLADAQDALAVAREDLRLANQLVELGNLNRASNTNLRRIQNKRAPLSAIRVQINVTKKDIADQMQARILAEDELRELTLRGANLSAEFEEWKADKAYSEPLSDTSLALLSSLNQRRNGYLTELINAATVNIDDANVLLEAQMGWRGQVSDLRDLLNKTLLWIPSSDIIGKNWPGQVLRGTAKLLDGDRLSLVARNFTSGLWRHAPIILIGFLLIVVLIGARKNLYETLHDISRKVGRVQEDSYWHTPRAVALCALISLPIPIALTVVGYVFSRAATPDPYILQLGRTGFDLAGFLWFFLTWREWNKGKALMGPHFNLSTDVRERLIRELKWFIPTATVFIGCVTATQNSRDIDIYSGFSVFVFIIVALIMAIFALRVFWAKSSAITQAVDQGNRIWKYRKTITILFVGLPILSAILAFLGFYETARVLLSRLLFSSGLIISTYVLYGLISRTVLVAQRRLSLQQAIERRDRVIKDREKQQAADERGEELPVPPSVDYDQIDVETMSRQTSQLMNTLVTVGFAVLMWVFWQDLLPALSAFDDVKINLGQSVGANGDLVQSSISLWTILKAIAVMALTIISAKNFPGFLEVFVLDNFKLEPGTRYAVITVLGYFIFAVGLTMAFSILGVEWAKFQWIVAALGVGIGFGLQEIIANFISGLIILFERPIRIGDYVTIGDQSGTVSRIKIRATTLTDLDNREILIPNKEIITGRVTNWTLSNAVTRLKMFVGIAYGSDTDKARDIMLGVLKSHSKTLDRPRPQALFTGFGESALDFELRAFIANFEDRFPVLDGLHSQINKALEAENISVPFPQRDLHIVSETYPPSVKSKVKKKLKPT